MTNPFTEHPQAVGETYLGHLCAAAEFAAWMFAGAAVCITHALLPFLFTHSASHIIERLHERMVLHRGRMTRIAGSTAAR